MIERSPRPAAMRPKLSCWPCDRQDETIDPLEKDVRLTTLPAYNFEEVR